MKEDRTKITEQDREWAQDYFNRLENQPEERKIERSDIRDLLVDAENASTLAEEALRGWLVTNPEYAEVNFEATEASETLHRAIEKLDRLSLRGN